MYSDDLKEIFGPRKWKSRTEEIMKLQAERDAARAKSEEAASGDTSDASGTTDSTDSTDTPETAVPVANYPTPPPYKG